MFGTSIDGSSSHQIHSSIPSIRTHDWKKFFCEGILKDVTLNLFDKQNTVEFSCCKPFLTIFDYFKNMFTSGMTEQTERVISIEVPNAHVMHDILSRVFDVKKPPALPHTNYVLDSILCYDFLGVNVTMKLVDELSDSKFIDLDFGPEHFNKFMIVAELLHFNETALNVIIKNYTDRSYLEQYSKELLEALLERNTTKNYFIAAIVRNDTSHQRPYHYDKKNGYPAIISSRGEIVHTFHDVEHRFGDITCFEISPDNKLCAVMDHDMLGIFDLEKKILLKTKKGKFFNTAVTFTFTPDSQYLMILNGACRVRITWCSIIPDTKNKHTKYIKFAERICHPCEISPDCQEVIICSHAEKASIFEVSETQLILKNRTDYFTIKYYPDGYICCDVDKVVLRDREFNVKLEIIRKCSSFIRTIHAVENFITLGQDANYKMLIFNLTTNTYHLTRDKICSSSCTDMNEKEIISSRHENNIYTIDDRISAYDKIYFYSTETGEFLRFALIKGCISCLKCTKPTENSLSKEIRKILAEYPSVSSPSNF